MTPIQKLFVIAVLALPVAVSAQGVFLGAQGEATASQQQINQEIRVQQGLGSGIPAKPEATKGERAQDRLADKLGKDGSGRERGPGQGSKLDLPPIGR